MRRLLTVISVLLLAGSMTVSAQGKGKGKEKGHEGKGKDTHVAVVKAKPQDAHVAVVFNNTQRGAVRTYFVDTYGRGNCPPGLAKKNNGCFPPGQAKKRYVVGQRLPSGVTIVEVPPALATRLGPPPTGYRYALVDGDLVKLAVGTMLVVDAINVFVR